jgi:hypothetical protein
VPAATDLLFDTPSFFGRRCFKCGAGLRGQKIAINGQKIALTAIADQTEYSIARADPRQAPCCQLCRIAFRAMLREMIDFLTNMPANTVIFITMAVLGLAATLIVLRRLI